MNKKGLIAVGIMALGYAFTWLSAYGIGKIKGRNTAYEDIAAKLDKIVEDWKEEEKVNE